MKLKKLIAQRAGVSTRLFPVPAIKPLPHCRMLLAFLVAAVAGAAEPAQTLAPAQTPRADRDSNLWLNVRDFGASGSTFETTAVTTAESKQITVANVGDFKVGQGVMVSKSNIRYTPTKLWGTGEPYRNTKPLQDSVEVRGYDGSAGSWVIYLLDLQPAASPAFRWSDDLGRTWHPPVPITHDWQSLNGGIEVRLNQRDWESGYVRDEREAGRKRHWPFSTDRQSHRQLRLAGHRRTAEAVTPRIKRLYDPSPHYH